MTNIEQLAAELETFISEQWHKQEYSLTAPIMQALTTAYTLGKSHATSEARKAASRNNGAAPVKPGSRKRGRPRKNETGQKEVKP